MKISVIICTHNPRVDYLQRTLGGLKNQTLEFGCWELLLIDNACTKPLAASWDLSWHPHARHVKEEKLGLTPARMRGIVESNGEVLIFVDDDNVLEKNYLRYAIDLLDLHTQIDCMGAGKLIPEYEEIPNKRLLPFINVLALRTVESDVWGLSSNIPEPWGAGLIVRKRLANLYLKNINDNKIHETLGRKGNALVSGDDNLFGLTALKHGRGIGLFTKLEILHLIDKKRINIRYFERLMYGVGISSAIISKYDTSLVQSRPAGSIAQLIYKTSRYPLRTILSDIYWLIASIPKDPLRRRFAKQMFKGWEDGLKMICNKSSI